MSNSPPPQKIKFDYIKSNYFRTARADGAWAGTNGYLDLILSFYSERSPIPKQTVHPVIDHMLGEEIQSERIARDAIVREIEICLSMNLDVAKSLHTLLGKQIAALESARTAASEIATVAKPSRGKPK
jgi:hypothetical protein